MDNGIEGLRETVALLDADPDLAVGLQPQDLDAARARAIASVIAIDAVRWDPGAIAHAADEGWIGLLLLEGLMLRQVTVGKRSSCEIFGPGDLIRPWDADGDYNPLTIAVAWPVLAPTRLAVLDTGFSLRIARWPSITGRLVGRVAQRARYLTLSQAVTHLPRAYARLLMLFWLLAERWGRVGPRGVHVTLPVTHDVLAMLAGAHRPTVSIALKRLSDAGLLTRERPDRWLLTNQAIEWLRDPGSDLPGVEPDRGSEAGPDDHRDTETA
jgi:CRP/FNR family transcriptional regulator, cyclic AMP receptor protein